MILLGAGNVNQLAEPILEKLGAPLARLDT